MFQIILLSELHLGNSGDLNDFDCLCKPTRSCCRYQRDNWKWNAVSQLIIISVVTFEESVCELVLCVETHPHNWSTIWKRNFGHCCHILTGTTMRCNSVKQSADKSNTFALALSELREGEWLQRENRSHRCISQVDERKPVFSPVCINQPRPQWQYVHTDTKLSQIHQIQSPHPTRCHRALGSALLVSVTSESQQREDGRAEDRALLER